ncbi:hypothetical protein DCMF_12760 [Candidatus Formimonas warabiya]|uniref:Uncharacterized protein n=1 Tax=Formimonas warabiya TaxID=1761012 RepID=A0A3G1KSW7_FORW1|nr:hypothetical protein DCMF_12760 [Candidatus Formimonas warabiya]
MVYVFTGIFLYIMCDLIYYAVFNPDEILPSVIFGAFLFTLATFQFIAGLRLIKYYNKIKKILFKGFGLTTALLMVLMGINYFILTKKHYYY